MPQQVTGVAIAIQSGDPTLYDVQIGGSGFQGRHVADLFDRTTFDEEHVFGNIRLKWLIGHRGEQLWSQEFTTALNAGLSTTAGDFYHLALTENVDGSYTLAFGTSPSGVANQTITMTQSDLENDTNDIEMVLKNIGAFLRKAGYTDLTTVAPNGIYEGKTGIQAVAIQTFRF